MRRQFVSLLVAVLIGVMPIAHEICLAGCSETSITTPSHHHEGAQSPEHQMAGHAMHGSHVAVAGHHHDRDAVKALSVTTECCAFVAAPACIRGGDDPTLLASTMKRALDPPATTADHVIAILSATAARPTSSLNARIGPFASRAQLTPLRI